MARNNPDTASAEPEPPVPNTDDPIVFDDAAPEIVEDAGVTPSSPDGSDVDSDGATPPPDDMFAAVEDALGGSSDPDPQEPEAKAGDQDDKSGTKGDGTDGKDGETDQDFLKQDPTDEEVENYSKKAQTRIRDLIDQRNHAKAMADRVAPVYDFIQKNDIPEQDLGVVLDLTARLRHGDFAGFLQGVQPYVNLALQYTGQVLPPDLQQQVKQGYVSPQVAKELAQRRVQEQWNQNRSQEQIAKSQQGLVRERANNIRHVITQWEQQARSQDPDYDLKADLVRRTAQALMQEEGIADTPEKALNYVQRAYEETNKQMSRFQPQRRATRPSPSATRTAKAGTAPKAEPSSMFEAAMQGLQNARGN